MYELEKSTLLFLGMICIRVSGFTGPGVLRSHYGDNHLFQANGRCSSLQDVVDREICAARQAIAAADEALGRRV